ncbi:hypothetical protein V8E36_001695 [Tilletia maclaganii]
MTPASKSDARAASRAKNRFDPLASLSSTELTAPDPGKPPPDPPEAAANTAKKDKRVPALAGEQTPQPGGPSATAPSEMPRKILGRQPMLSGGAQSLRPTRGTSRTSTPISRREMRARSNSRYARQISPVRHLDAARLRPAGTT